MEEGGDRQAEGEPAQLLLQPVPAPERDVRIPQNHIGIPGVDIQHQSGQSGLCPAQGAGKGVAVGEAFAVDHHTHQALPTAVGADIEVADQPQAGAFVVGRDGMGLHPVLEGLPQAGDRLRLEGAVRGVQHVVTPGAVVAHGQAALAL